MEHMEVPENNMENTHEKVEQIIKLKELEKAKLGLVDLATKDIHGFILHCEAHGFSAGIKTGFIIGVFISVFIYLLIK